MAIRKRKKKQIDEGPFLFSEEEMSGMITNVAIIETPGHEKAVIPSEPETSDEEPLPLTDEQQCEVVAETEHEAESVVVEVHSLDE